MMPPPPRQKPVQEFSASHLQAACPHCNVHLSIHPSQAGTVIYCPKCGGRFEIPLPTANALHSTQSTIFGNDPLVDSFASKKIAAGICGILIGGLGIHKFILGLNTPGIIMLTVWLVGFMTGLCLFVPLLAAIAMNLIGFIEGIIYLSKSDTEFYRAYAVEKREWF